MSNLVRFLELSAQMHNHLCPRQVLGVRMGMYAADLLGVPCPQANKRLYTFVETDGCFVDGVAVSTGCTIGHRTMRLIDYGKVAATFVDTNNEHAIRIRPSLNIRELSKTYATHERSRWHTQLNAYQIIPLEELFDVQDIQLNLSIKEIISRPGLRVNCHACGEEIMNEREIVVDGLCYCQSCVSQSYYQVQEERTLEYSI